MTHADTITVLPPKPKPEKDWMSRKEAAIYLTRMGYTIAPQTLAKLGCNNNAGKGPAFTRQGWKAVVYARADLDAWRRKRSVRVE